jgi:hypothetical protein
MNSKWCARILTLSLSSGWACSSEPDSRPGPSNKISEDAGESGGGGAGAGPFIAQSGKGGAASLGGSPHESGGAGAVAAKASAGNADAPSGEAGSATGGEGGDAFGRGGSAGSAGEGGSAGSAEEGGSAGQANGSVVGPHCNGCTEMELKAPTWRLAGAFMTVAPLGSPATGTAAYFEWLDELLSPNHEPMEGVYGPGVPHARPYDDELFQLLTVAGGSARQSFTADEFGGLNGVALFLSAVPNASAPHGSSADFASGPILPNELFPFYVDGDLYRDGVLYDGAFDGLFPGYNAFSPAIDKDGPSHLLLPFAENSSYVPDIEAAGSYVFRIKIVDTSDAGWILDVPFTVQ